MAKEKAAYRDNLEFLLERSGGRALLNVREVCEICGISYNTARKLFTFNAVSYTHLDECKRKG